MNTTTSNQQHNTGSQDHEERELNQRLEERKRQLPQVVQSAIDSADIKQRLRSLAQTHKLHVDQWELLENEVQLTLYGFQKVEDLEKNIQKEVGVASDLARTLAESISSTIFEPIREELERQLEHPEAKRKEISDVETAREQTLTGIPPALKPATPPSPPPDVKITRPTELSAYKPGEPSSQRDAVHDDPYREPLQ